MNESGDRASFDETEQPEDKKLDGEGIVGLGNTELMHPSEWETAHHRAATNHPVEENQIAGIGNSIERAQAEEVDRLPHGPELVDEVYKPALKDLSDDEINSLLSASQKSEAAQPALEHLKDNLQREYGLDKPVESELDADLPPREHGLEGELDGPAKRMDQHLIGMELSGDQVTEGAGRELHGRHEIAIDPEKGDPVHALGHEMRHAAQNEAYEDLHGPGKQAPYESSKVYGYEAYANQPEELDAEVAGHLLGESLREEAKARGLI